MIHHFDPSLIQLSTPEYFFFLPSLVDFILQYPKKYSLLSSHICYSKVISMRTQHEKEFKKKTNHIKCVVFHTVLMLKVSKKCKFDLHLFFNGQNFQSIPDRLST